MQTKAFWVEFHSNRLENKEIMPNLNFQIDVTVFQQKQFLTLYLTETM